MLNPLFTAEEMHRQLADSGARFVFTVPERLATVREAAPGRGSRRSSSSARRRARRRSQHCSSATNRCRQSPSIRPKTWSLLPYSSGTTGRAKGVMLTHRNLVAAVLRGGDATRSPEDDTVVIVFPFFHIGGIAVLNARAPRRRHARPHAPLRSAHLPAAAQEYRVTRVCLPPPIVLALSRHPIVAEYDLSRLGSSIWAAAPLGEAVAGPAASASAAASSRAMA